MIILNRTKRWLNSDDISKVLVQLEKTKLNKDWVDSNRKAKMSRESRNLEFDKVTLSCELANQKLD